MRGWVYWPECGASGELNFIGYNHAVSIIRRAVGDVISSDRLENAKCRLYCNIPWHHNPKQLKKEGLPLVAYTMFEATKLPNHWRDFLNKECAAAIVPTRHCRDMFRISGVKIPIEISSLAIDEDEIKPIPIKDHAGYNFLWQGHNYDPNGRKGAASVETAFRELISEGTIGKDCSLFMKYRPHKQFPTEMDFVPMGQNIFHISGTLPRDKINELYSIVDCCVNATHGEGFGFIPLEQMAIGRPVICTDWSFPFLDPDACYPVQYDLKPSPVNWCFKHFSFGRWGFDYTWNGLIHENMMPFLRQKPANGEIEYGIAPDGKFGEVKSKRTFKKTMQCLAADIQKATGFYWKPNAPRHTFLFEFQGYDAWINQEDLKNKMAECYNNQDAAREKGGRASRYAFENWGFKRAGNEFKAAIKNLCQKGVI